MLREKKKAALHSVFSVLPFVCWEEGLGIFTNLWINYLWKEVREPINSSCFQVVAFRQQQKGEALLDILSFFRKKPLNHVNQYSSPAGYLNHIDARCQDGAVEATPEWLSEVPASNSYSFTNLLSSLKQATPPRPLPPRPPAQG